MNYFKIIVKNCLVLLVLQGFAMTSVSGRPGQSFGRIPDCIFTADTNKISDTTLKYPFTYDATLPGGGKTNPLYLKNPSNIKTVVEYDPATHQYYNIYKVGNETYRIPSTMSFSEYQDQDMQNLLQNYWKERSEAAGIDNAKGVIPKIHIPGKFFETIFGNNTVDIRPQGSAQINFGIISNRRDDPMLNTRQRRQTNFDFNEKIQMNVIAKIGDKIEFKINYNTQATFDFENTLKLKYEGKEDDIIQLIEGGNVNMPLNTTLIKGTESLFGIKAKLRFGRLTVTALYSQQKSETKSITVQGNAQTNKFRLRADEYEENRHFFLAQYFRDHYTAALKTLPIISTSVNILKIEVWVTNIGAAVTENRNIVAFQDLGEFNPYNKREFYPNPGQSNPSNNSNNLFTILMKNAADSAKVRNINTVTDYLSGSPYFLVSGLDFEKIESARKLLTTEYTFNPRLGFISLNTNLNSDQTLAVAYQYQIVGDPRIYQVGEFSDQGINSPKGLVVKLLKSTSLDTHIPMWNLMMKNVYSLGAYQVQAQNFTLNVLYNGNSNGVPTAYISESRIKGVPLLRVLNFDNLNMQMNPPPDGMFDFIDQAATMGGTIQSSNGRIFFTVLEPFGQSLRDSILDNNDPSGSRAIANKYCFDSLYTLTKSQARQYPEKNKFVLDGFYKSTTGSEISLNALNVPQGSVKVSAGGVQLTENVDFTVDYTLGRVRIINEGLLNSGTPISITMESNQMFNIQTKRLMGAHLDYRMNKDFMLGATVMNLNERPLTQKVNYGDEPMSNTIWGFNLSYRAQSRLITRLVDALPFISTKAPSNVAIDAEFADFIPGHSKSIGKTGTTYIDDFEGSQSTIDLKNIGTWFLASTPQLQTASGMFPEAAPDTTRKYGFNRAKLAWYIIDPLFYDKNTSLVPPNVSLQELSKNEQRQVWETEVFPNKQPLNGVPVNLAVFNLAYYPKEKGPYNYDVQPTLISKGLNPDGTLASPETRWGGIMRRIETTDFDAANVQYIEFWMMDPFADSTSTNQGGDLYFNLGDVSEDILRDGRKSYENGLPTSALVTNVDTTIWGRVPRLQALVDAFDNDPATRPYQDVGYDGLSDADERTFFDAAYVSEIKSAFGQGSQAYKNAFSDPSGDDYHYFRGSDYDNDPTYGNVLQRYKKFNGPEGNSPTQAQSPESYPTLATTIPNIEDINKDNTLSESERYYQYVVHLRRNQMQPGMNYINNVYYATNIPLADGQRGAVKWYQFKIPIRTPDKVVGNISDFTSIRFMRMFFKDFKDSVVCRFATLELTRGEWRRYTNSLLSPGEYVPDNQQSQTTFDIATVSIEENGSKQPIPYVMPPGIQRETNWGSTNMQKMNEQSMSFKICNLVDGDARGAYKTCEFDFRQFKFLNMFVHAEKSISSQDMKTGDLTVFIRLGSDFTENYYEYEIPLQFTPWGTSVNNPDAIWPDANAFNIDLNRLVQVKYNRYVVMAQHGANVSLSYPYSEMDGANKITIVGSPTISDIKSLMIGVRNPKKGGQNKDDDGQAKCAEIWVDELRLTGFNKQGGWAATARLSADLADLGRVQFTGSYSSSGFGSLEQKQTERAMEAITMFGFDTDLELGKFFSAKTGIRIPFHFDYSMQKNTPKYDPLNPDLYLSDVLKIYDNKAEKDSIKRLTEGYTYRKNFNLMNVRKERTNVNRKSKIYDIENFNISYSYSEIFHRDVDIEYDLSKKYMGAFAYNYSALPPIVTPLSKVKFLRSRYLSLFRDFNFYYLPKSFSFRTDMNREFDTRKFRNKTQAIVPMETFYMKTWNWNRMYDLKWDLTRSLKLSLIANAQAFINEPPGVIDRSNRSQVWDQVFSFGTMNNYNQAFSITWDLPFSKIPILDWITLSAGYQGSYRWTASALSVQAAFGNTAENNSSKMVNGSFNFVNLYNKIPYLKKINTGAQNNQKNIRGPAKQPEKNTKTATQDSLKNEKSGKNVGKMILDGSLRVLMAVRSAKFMYSQASGVQLPGFYPNPQALGNNWSQNAPGLGFVFGDQKDIRQKAGDRGWISKDTMLNTAYVNKFTEAFTANVTVEPIKDFRIEINATRNFSSSRQEYYKWSPKNAGFSSFSPMEFGTFSMSTVMIATAFDKQDNFGSSPAFEKLRQVRKQIADRYAAQNPNSIGITDSTGFPVGYGPDNLEVLSTAFISAYQGRDPSKIRLTAFPSIPIPNWRLTYDGFAKLPWIKTFLRTLTITHAYICTYTVGNYVSNIKYGEANGYPNVLDDAGNFIPSRQIGVMTINEQFSPLIRIDLGFINSLLANFEMRRSRTLSLSFVNNQLTEITSSEFIIGLGYRIKGIKLNFSGVLGGGKKAKTKSDLALKLDFSIRKNRTTLRTIDQDINQISIGQQVMNINFTADYNLSQKFTIQFYFKKDINTPYVSNQYRTSNTQGGLALRFSLSQ
ncbi:MAG: cell surface protein SprA [Bacteroidetes bacterium]|nr:cell surface protein SprA [Bacteroidota bacterium]